MKVISRSENTPHGKARWLCVCSCGTKFIAQGDNLQTGRTKSCGHNNIENLRKNKFVIHGMSGTRVYASWLGMLRRCYDDHYEKYRYYGGRGIGVCDQWVKSFDQFYSDMGDRPNNHTLDRIDVNKGYSPDNCRWATVEQQANNTRSNVFIQHNGKVLSLAQWARLLGGSGSLIHGRLKLGWDQAKAVSTPVTRKGR